MRKNLLNIFRRKTGALNDHQLMDYLSGRLTGTARHDVEAWLADQEEFGNDALEGLQSIRDKGELPLHLKKMHSNLAQALASQKKSSKRRGIAEMKWLYLAIVLILFFLLAGYLIISRLQS